MHRFPPYKGLTGVLYVDIDLCKLTVKVAWPIWMIDELICKYTSDGFSKFVSLKTKPKRSHLIWVHAWCDPEYKGGVACHLLAWEHKDNPNALH